VKRVQKRPGALPLSPRGARGSAPGVLILLLSACTTLHPTGPTYTVGAPYRIGDVWQYPRENYGLSQTGLATTQPNSAFQRPRLTADGEVYDGGALAAAHPSLQLPAVARLTNLDNGYQVVVRINDRGPATPTRFLAVTPRTAQLLGAADPTAIRLRLEELEPESRAMADALRQDAPRLAVDADATAAVTTETLAPPSGAATAGRSAAAAPVPRPVAVDAPPPPVPLRLPETVTAVRPEPGQLMIDCGAFSSAQYANLLSARLAGLGARTTTSYNAPRNEAYRVRIGPFAGVAEADAMLARAWAQGAPDARIVLE
jgi:rare lipoprotein A